MKGKQFSIVFLILSCVLLSIYIALIQFQYGSKPFPLEVWIAEVEAVKSSQARKIQVRKAIVISGSNSLFGIDSEAMSKELGMPVINLAIHVGLDISYLAYLLKKNMGPGDIVIMPLEYDYYQREGFSRWFVENMSAWGQDYVQQLGRLEYADFVTSASLSQTLFGVKAKLDGKLYVCNDERVIASFNQALDHNKTGWAGLSYKSLNAYGDMLAPTTPLNVSDRPYRIHKPYVSDRFLKSLNAIQRLVEQNQGRLFLTHPVTFIGDGYNLYEAESQNTIRSYVAILKGRYNVVLSCNPGLFHLSDQFKYDTNSHTTSLGALVRSENLGACINKELQGEVLPMTINEALAVTRQAESRALSANKRTLRAQTVARQNHLQSIKQALQAYFDAKGRYPESEGFDGLISEWGYSGVDWIQGLVPEFLPKLPHDPGREANRQYLYKSDGVDYKLIAHNSQDCHSISRTNPDLIDPVRDCWAYGYWTKGAEHW